MNRSPIEPDEPTDGDFLIIAALLCLLFVAMVAMASGCAPKQSVATDEVLCDFHRHNGPRAMERNFLIMACVDNNDLEACDRLYELEEELHGR